jgi:hypothetical protein
MYYLPRVLFAKSCHCVQQERTKYISCLLACEVGLMLVFEAFKKDYREYFLNI